MKTINLREYYPFYTFNQGNPEIKYFNCSNYKGNRGTCTATHYIRVDFLEQVVLGEIRRLTRFASKYETKAGTPEYQRLQ